MKLQDVVKRTDELIQLGENALSTSYQPQHAPGPCVEAQSFARLRAAALSFLTNTFGTDSPFYREFESSVTDITEEHTQRAIGILRACRNELAGGWVFRTKAVVFAEVSSSFLSVCDRLLGEACKDPAAAIAGCVLEEHLRQLCRKHSIAVDISKPGAASVPLKIENLNVELAKANAYSKLDLTSVTAWLDLRNKATHGKYAEYRTEHISAMVRGISDFIARTPV